MWIPCEEGGPARAAGIALRFATSALLASLGAGYVALLVHLGGSLLGGHAAARVAIGAAALVAFSPAAAAWLVACFFELWGSRWTYRSVDGTRWGSFSVVRGWVGAGEGTCLTALEPTAAGSTALSSWDAIHAGLPVVARHLSRLQGATGGEAFGPLDAVVLAALAGLSARGSATISRGRALRWRRGWLGWTERSAPETAFTIERARVEQDGGPVEGGILEALQAVEESLAPAPPHEIAEGYRKAPRTPPAVRVLLDDALRAPAIQRAAAALAAPAFGGAPFAVAVAIDDFARRDPDRLRHLRRLLAQRGAAQACVGRAHE